jgi:hypothetical protein
MKNREFTFTLATGEKVEGATLSEALSKLSPEEKIKLQKEINEKNKKEPEDRPSSGPNTKNEEGSKEEKIKLFEQQYNEWLTRKQKLETLEVDTQKLREKRDIIEKEIKDIEKKETLETLENNLEEKPDSKEADKITENPLENIESTTKALEDFSQRNPKEFLDIKKKLKPKYKTDAEIFGLMDEKERNEWEHNSTTPGKKRVAATLLKNANERFNVIERTSQEVAEEYHKAKIDKSNPKLIKAIETALAEKIIEKSEDEDGESNITNKENINRGLDKKFVEDAVKDVLIKFLSESEKIRRVDPKRDNFSLESTEEGFVARAFVSIKTGLKEPKTAIMNLSIPLLNKDGKLDIGGLSMGGGLAIPTEIRREVADYLLPTFVGKIKSYFEEKYKTPIKSMMIANDKLVVDIDYDKFSKK